MKQESFFLRMDDGFNLFTYVFEPDQPPVAAVQIAHGMAEHAGRYQELAVLLTSAGYIVYAHDHRGHGKTAKTKQELGYFADEQGWERVVQDLFLVTQEIKNRHPVLPIFLLGHSMGSFLVRTYIQDYGHEISGAILSGTGAGLGFLGLIAIQIAKGEVKRRGKRGQSERLNQITFGKYNKPFEPVRTPFDWLTRDEKAVDMYMDDPLCGNVSSALFYADLFHGLMVITEPKRLKQIPKSLPILLIAGDKDPVGHFGKGVAKAYRQYKKVGMEDAQMILYKEARHEIFNETNREEVYNDVLSWLQSHGERES